MLEARAKEGQPPETGLQCRRQGCGAGDRAAVQQTGLQCFDLLSRTSDVSCPSFPLVRVHAYRKWAVSQR